MDIERCVESRSRSADKTMDWPRFTLSSIVVQIWCQNNVNVLVDLKMTTYKEKNIFV